MMVQERDEPNVLSRFLTGNWASIVYPDTEDKREDVAHASREHGSTVASFDSSLISVVTETDTIPTIRASVPDEDGIADDDVQKGVSEFFHKSWSGISEIFSAAPTESNNDMLSPDEKRVTTQTSWASNFLSSLDGIVPDNILDRNDGRVKEPIEAEEEDNKLLNALLPGGFRVGEVRLPDKPTVPGVRYLRVQSATTTHTPAGPCLVFIHCLGLVPFAQAAHCVASSSVLEKKFTSGIFLLEVLDATEVERPDEALALWGTSLASWASELDVGHITVIACGPARLLAYGLQNARSDVRVRIAGPSTSLATPQKWTEWIQEASPMFADFTEDHHNPYLCLHPTTAWLENTSAKGLIRFVTRMPPVIQRNVFKRLGRQTATGLSWTAYLEKEFHKNKTAEMFELELKYNRSKVSFFLRDALEEISSDISFWAISFGHGDVITQLLLSDSN